MDRLTRIDENGINFVNYVACENCKYLYDEECDCEQVIIDRLAHYENLEEQGKMIELPCKVGDIIKVFTDECGIIDMEVIEIYPHGIPSFDFKSQNPTVINVVLEDDDYNEIDLSFEDLEEEIKKAELKLKEMKR